MDADKLSQTFADGILPLTIIIGILAVFGLLGNGLVLYAYKWKYPKCNFRTFVLCIGIIDFATCMFVFPTEMAQHRMWFTYPVSAAWFCKLMSSIYGYTVFASSYILLLISIDRFRKLCRPLSWQIKQNTAFRMCLLIFGITIILGIPCPIFLGLQTSNITYEREYISITSCELDDKYKHSAWVTVYVATVFFGSVIAFMVTQMVLYGMVLRKLFSANFMKSGHRSKLGRTHRHQEIKFSENEKSESGFGSDSFLEIRSSGAEEYKINKDINPDVYECINNTSSISDNKTKSNSNKQNAIVSDREIELDADYLKSDNELQHPGDPGKANIKHEELKQAKDSKEKENSNEENSETTGKSIQPDTNEKLESEADSQDITTNRSRVATLKSNQISTKQRIRNKSFIMFIVALIFNITTLIHFYVYTLILQTEHIFEIVMPNSAWILVLFWRLYFVNHVINPVIYGCLDSRFRKVIIKVWRNIMSK